jgi:hypothetical protein
VKPQAILGPGLHYLPTISRCKRKHIWTVDALKPKRTGQIETSTGVAWTGTIHYNGTPIGTVDDRGDGGAPTVRISHPAARSAWNTTVNNSYPSNTMGEEHLISHLDFTAQGM